MASDFNPEAIGWSHPKIDDDVLSFPVRPMFYWLMSKAMNSKFLKGAQKTLATNPDVFVEVHTARYWRPGSEGEVLFGGPVIWLRIVIRIGFPATGSCPIRLYNLSQAATS
jgi:hypothetical protein